MGFNDIALLSSKIQESLDSSGYPYKLSAKEMSFKDRLLSTLNIYTSLRQEKKYRKAYSHNEVINILKDMSNNKKVDFSIVKDLDIILVPN
jgi:HD-GYP domain-containing protein (c-di-GMP phosphodiesterase class II)